ncbi:MFS transporter [Rhodococcus koreensis]
MLIVACFLGILTSVFVLVPFSLGATIPTLQAEFGWDRATGASLLTLSGIAAGVVGIGAGALIDRLGLRTVLCISVPAYAVAQLFIGFAFSRGADTGVIQLLFLLSGIAGSGAGIVAYSRAIVGRLTTARGLALGLIGLGSSAAAMIFPPLVTTLLPRIGLPSMHIIYAVLVMVPLPLLIVTLRERTGTTDKSPTPSAATVSTDMESRWSVLRSSVFWRLFLIFSLLGGVATIINTHTIPALTDRGISPMIAAGMIATISLGSLTGRLLAGFLLDLVNSTRLIFVFFLLAAPSFLTVVWGPVGFVYGAMFAAGMTFGSETDFLGYYLSRWQGVNNIAFTMALVFFGLTFVGGFTPYFAGLAYQASGSYNGVAIYTAAAVLLSAILVISLPKVTTVKAEKQTQTQTDTKHSSAMAD